MYRHKIINYSPWLIVPLIGELDEEESDYEVDELVSGSEDDDDDNDDTFLESATPGGTSKPNSPRSHSFRIMHDALLPETKKLLNGPGVSEWIIASLLL